MKRFFQIILLLTLSVVFLSGCSKFKKIQKSADMDKKYEAAVAYYNNKEYYKALMLMEELVTIYRGSSKGEMALYYFAKSYYKTDDLISAAYYFETFTKTYGNSPFAEECAYLIAYCNYLQSPKSSLDQESSYEAIRQFQLFINHYPNSSYIKECNAHIDELYAKLEEKEFNSALMYYKMQDYKASIVALSNIIKDHPQTANKQQCLYLIAKSSYIYAFKSIETKQKERFEAALGNCKQYLENFPDGKENAEVKELLARSEKFLLKLAEQKKI
ncbi:MAG: outer membrane protein assembly factor BamD [Bacteroidetes bacterium]|nr:outer membrane protein assembly factor BamD [Bacteroidota bacterium]